MKVTSSKNGSSRERVDADVDLLPIANWRVAFVEGKPGFVQAQGRRLVLASRWGGERASELWLTEEEALAIAKAVTEDLFSKAASLSSHKGA